ncbi:MAG: hypothetical protein ACP5D2_04975, partial [Candidatus Nanoarchaeia archaeon]
DTYAQVDITNAQDLYAYEINFDYNGDSVNVDYSDFLSNGSTTSEGDDIKDGVLSVYQSRLNNQKTGISGSGNLFNISHSGSLDLRYALFVSNNSAEETYVYYNESAEEEPSGTSGTSGGGGGGGAVSIPVVGGVELDVSELVLNMVLNSHAERVIKITNLGDAKTLSLGNTNLDGIVLFEKEQIEIGANETKELRVVFVAPDETGVRTGKILIGGHEILITINTESKLLLFDAMISISDKEILEGSTLDSQVTLLPMGEEPRLDVYLTYYIKDFSGNTHLLEEDTILVEAEKSFKRRFDTSKLEPGRYVLGLELKYPNGVATSSSNFEIVEGNIFLKYIIIGGILFVIIGLILLFIRYEKTKKKGRKK